MAKAQDKIVVIIQKGKKRVVTRVPLSEFHRMVFVINHQFTNAPNTTQIASGSGRSSAAGNNAAIASPYTRQQQSVGAGGDAANLGLKGGHSGGRRGKHSYPVLAHPHGKELVVVINDQIVKLPRGSQASSATQVASGSGFYSTGGTNSAIESRGTRQQQAVGGGSGGHALNKSAGRKSRSRRRSSRTRGR